MSLHAETVANIRPEWDLPNSTTDRFQTLAMLLSFVDASFLQRDVDATTPPKPKEGAIRPELCAKKKREREDDLRGEEKCA